MKNSGNNHSTMRNDHNILLHCHPRKNYVSQTKYYDQQQID